MWSCASEWGTVAGKNKHENHSSRLHRGPALSEKKGFTVDHQSQLQVRAENGEADQRSVWRRLGHTERDLRH